MNNYISLALGPNWSFSFKEQYYRAMFYEITTPYSLHNGTQIKFYYEQRSGTLTDDHLININAKDSDWTKYETTKNLCNAFHVEIDNNAFIKQAGMNVQKEIYQFAKFLKMIDQALHPKQNKYIPEDYRQRLEFEMQKRDEDTRAENMEFND